MSVYLRKFYRQYNRTYFGGKLPDISVIWSDETHPKCAAEFITNEDGSHYVRFSPEMKEYRRYTKMILLHEMVHVEQRGQKIKDHGTKFKSRMRELVAQGAFDNLW